MFHPSSKHPQEKADQHVQISTPKREALLLSPSAFIEIAASPSSKRYSSIRKIDFESCAGRKVHASAKKLDFLNKHL